VKRVKGKGHFYSALLKNDKSNLPFIFSIFHSRESGTGVYLSPFHCSGIDRRSASRGDSDLRLCGLTGDHSGQGRHSRKKADGQAAQFSAASPKILDHEDLRRAGIY